MLYFHNLKEKKKDKKKTHAYSYKATFYVSNRVEGIRNYIFSVMCLSNIFRVLESNKA